MRYNPRARLDRSQVENRRGSSGGGMGGLGGFPVGGGGGGLRVGGGIGGLVVVGLVVLLSQFMGGGGGGDTAPDTGTSSWFDQCQSGADANTSADCALVA